MPTLPDNELTALTLLRQAAITAARQLQACESAVNAYLDLLRAKYQADIDYNTGAIIPRPPKEEPPPPPSTPP